MARTNYGVPYKGSKNLIAEWVVSHVPECGMFVDVFAGGCAITDCILRKGRAKRVIANDLDAAPVSVVSINTTFRHNTVVFDVPVERPDGTQRSLLSDKPDVLKAIFDTVRVRERYRADSWERQWKRREWRRV